MTSLKVFSRIIFMIALSLTTVFCILPDDDFHSGTLSVPCNFTAASRSCLNCNTRVICKSIGGLVKPCRKLNKPHCVDGRCNARPSIKCAAYKVTEAKKTLTVTRKVAANMASTIVRNSITSSDIKKSTTEGDTSEGSTSEGGTTDDTSDESPSDGTSKGTTDENTTTESVSDGTTDNDESELIAESSDNDE